MAVLDSLAYLNPGVRRDLDKAVDVVESVERTIIVAALEKSGWVKSQAARMPGLGERVLTYKMNNLGIGKP